MTLPKLQVVHPTLGCDPEFFFRSNGSVIGAEKVFKKNGLKAGSVGSKFIIDGVQAELNPVAHTCREVVANEIRSCMMYLKTELTRNHKDITLDFSRSVEISKDKLDELSEESKKFGCAPSNCIYKSNPTMDIKKVDPEKYRLRAAGGHIHIGDLNWPGVTKDVEKTVRLLDIICGNTSVLVDRDEGNIERRKLYGRAGEYRLPPHGLEYRTLSNYWLTSVQLFSFAFGMARQAAMIMCQPDKVAEDIYNAFNDAVDIRNVTKAINTNDYDLAMENFKAITPVLLEITPIQNSSGSFPINRETLPEFMYFVDKINTHGLIYWFKQEPLDHWCSPINWRHSQTFFLQTVAEDRKQSAKRNAA